MVDDLCLAGGFDPKKLDFKTLCVGEKVIVLGQPGAFTPC
jgi:peroxiredoxin